MMKFKDDSNYYYQIQGQMHITKRHVLFFMYTPKWTKLEVIEYSETFRTQKILPKLTLYVPICKVVI